ncbi:MAG TPA: hypothetical protein GXX51_00605 [Firmicutes bacterium]|nr:hypothetical protein [Bacillota bacterium]
MKPLKITAYMQTGKIATTDLYLPLDSILAEAWMRKYHPERMAGSQSSIKPEDFIIPELPLERRGEGDDWYWACSFACGEPRQEEIVHWHKRFDQALGEQYVDFEGRRGKVDTHSGAYKGYRMPLVTYLISKLEWYAMGDADGVGELLRDVTHIGKKRSQGYGRVARWDVEDYPEDLSHLRALPDPDGGEMGIRPPYWLAWQWRRARIPDDPRLACNAVLGVN